MDWFQRRKKQTWQEFKEKSGNFPADTLSTVEDLCWHVWIWDQKTKERKKIFQGLDLKFLLNFEVHLLPFENVKVLADLQKESPPFPLENFNWHFYKKKMRRKFLLEVFLGIEWHTHIKENIFSMLRLKEWKGNQTKRQRFLQGLVWLEECTKFPCWFIRSLSTERQSPSRRKSLSLSPCSSSALDDKEDNENDLITWMISLDQEIDNSANTKIRGWSVMWTRNVYCF